jgi:nitrate reductase NapE component
VFDQDGDGDGDGDRRGRWSALDYFVLIVFTILFIVGVVLGVYGTIVWIKQEFID